MDSQVQALAAKTTKKGTRKRVITACIECTRRKQKCNREWPCNHCLNRRVAERCRYGVVKSQEPNCTSTEKSTRAKESPEYKINRQILMSSSNEEQWEDEIDGDENGGPVLESIGYVVSGTSKLVNELASLGLGNRKPLVSVKVDDRRTRLAVLAMFPPRPTVDFLIQHFLHEMNWIYEIIHPSSFLLRYNSWWLQENFFAEDDLQFAILILRLCAHSLQFLPNSKYPTDGLIDTTLKGLEKKCHSAALELETYRPRPKSLTRIQQLYFEVVYLKNDSRIKDCRAVLELTVKEAQQMGLHLESPPCGTCNEFELEMRRRVFWNLYYWDRWMSSFCGLWPLIPEMHCNIGLPLDSLPYDNAPPNAPTPFLERVLQLQLTQRLGNLQSGWIKVPPTEVSIQENVREFQEEFIKKLPPVFRLDKPDLSWDARFPDLAMKREQLHIAIHAFVANLHRPCNVSQMSMRKYEAHCILLENLTSLLKCLQRLHELMGGAPHQFFMLPMFSIEAAAVLGMALMSPNFNKPPISESDLHRRAYSAFLETRALLEVLSPRSLIAKKGAFILTQLHNKMQLVSPLEGVDLVPGLSPSSNALSSGVDEITNDPYDPIEPLFQEFDWSQMAKGSNMEWFFDDEIFQSQSNY